MGSGGSPLGAAAPGGPLAFLVGCARSSGEEGALGIGRDTLDAVAAGQFQQSQITTTDREKGLDGRFCRYGRRNKMPGQRREFSGETKQCYIRSWFSRDFVELIHAIIDVLQIGIDIRPSPVRGSDGWPVVGRWGLKIFTFQHSSTAS